MTDAKERGKELFNAKAQAWVYELNLEVSNPAMATKVLLKKIGVDIKDANIPKEEELGLDEAKLKLIQRQVKLGIDENRIASLKNTDTLERNFIKLLKENNQVNIEFAEDILQELDDKQIGKYSELLSKKEIANAEGILGFLENTEIQAMDYPCKFITRDGLTSYYIYWRLYRAAMEHLGNKGGVGFIEWAITAKKPMRVFLNGCDETERLRTLIEDNRKTLQASGAFKEYSFGLSWKYTAIQNIVTNTCKHIGCEIKVHARKPADKAKGEDLRTMKAVVYDEYRKKKLISKKTSKPNQQSQLLMPILIERMREDVFLSSKEIRLIEAIGTTATIFPSKYIRLDMFRRIIHLLETESLKADLEEKIDLINAIEEKDVFSSKENSIRHPEKIDVFKLSGVSNG